MTPLQEATDRLNRAAIGLLKRREIDRIAAKHRPKISAFFRRQRDITLEKFKGYDFLFTESYRALREVANPNEFLTTHDMDRLWSEVDSETFDDLQRVIAGVESDGVQAGGNQLSKMLSIDPSKKPGTTFNLANPRAVAWFQKTGGSTQYISGIQATTGESIKRLMTTAIDEGWSYGQSAKEIRKLFDGPISRDRAQRIAVFESGQAYEAGNNAFAKSLEDDGVTMEEHWMTSHDEKVRPEHAANEAEGWVEMGHTFSSGDTEPPTDPGCRCYMVYQAASQRG
jgi:uncharacterized protein with gpF-like domain